MKKSNTKSKKNNFTLREWDFYTDLSKKSDVTHENKEIETITFDFQQNLPLPLLPSGDVSYNCQLWIYSFCIYETSSKSS
jgi:hypothetical protein